MSASKGIWVTPNEFVNFADTKPPVGEWATRARALGWQGSGMWLPNPDPILRKRGVSQAVYRDLLMDAHVGGCVRRRKAAVKALQCGLERGSATRRAFQLTQAMLSNLDIDRLIGDILDAPLFGYQPIEVVWEYQKGLIAPTKVIGKPCEWFVFDTDNQLRFRAVLSGALGELPPPKKFLLPRQDPSYDNPYGMPDLARCFWPTQFKRGGFKFWLNFTEKYGTPWLVGKHPRGTPDEETESFLAVLDALSQCSVSVIPDDSSVEIVEASGKGQSVDVYERFLMFCRSEVSIALLGQNQTMEKDTNHASARAGQDVDEAIRDSDAKLTADTVNQLIRWWGELNLDGDLPLWTIKDPNILNTQQASRDQNLTKAGAKFTRSYFQRSYGLLESDLNASMDEAQPTENASFAEGDDPLSDQRALDDAIAQALSGATLQKEAEAWLAPVLSALKEGGETAALGRLADLYPTLDDRALARRLGHMLFIAELWGQYHAIDPANT